MAIHPNYGQNMNNILIMSAIKILIKIKKYKYKIWTFKARINLIPHLESRIRTKN